MREICKTNVWALHQLLKKKFDDRFKSLDDKTSVFIFSKKNLEFKMELIVNAFEFENVVLQRDLSIVKSQLQERETKIESLKKKIDELEGKIENLASWDGPIFESNDMGAGEIPF